MFSKIHKDLASIFKHDPAARNKFEVILTYSGFHALVMYRFAHFMHIHGYKLIARIVSQLAKFLTGIEIHPGAKIGYGVFIDHGEGVVIGETAVVGNNVVMYQGVTLGVVQKLTGVYISVFHKFQMLTIRKYMKNHRIFYMTSMTLSSFTYQSTADTSV